MDTTEFTNLYLQTLLDTLAFENKDIFLMGDFNINILQYDNGKSRIQMFQTLFCHNIPSPSRVTLSSQLLIT